MGRALFGSGRAGLRSLGHKKLRADRESSFSFVQFGLGGDRYLPEPELPSLLDIRRHLYGESLLATLLVPVRFFFQGQDFSARYFDGVLNPFLLLLPIPAVIRRARWEIRPLAVFSGLWVLLVFLSAAFTLVRYVVPICRSPYCRFLA